jgi:glycosyltransferase involved in cell wall biosynthesis
VRVLIDAHMLGQRETGNETYVRGLLAGLASLDHVTVAAAIDPGYELAEDSAVTWLRLPTSSSWRRLSGDMAALCRRWNADIVHSTYLAPYRLPCPVAVSVHDVSFRRFPEFFSWRDRLLFSTLLPGSLRRAAGILTLSSHARDEIHEFFPGLKAGIHVVPAAPGAVFRPMDDAEMEPVLLKNGLERPYFLAVGSLQPRKNLLRLIEAYADLRRVHPEIYLVIVGPGGFRSSRVRDAILERGLSDTVRWLGYVTDADLAAIYNAAVALVYPSVYEGFGLPVIEAMACGRPVIAANTSSLPEVAGDAGILVNPLDVSDLRGAMMRILDDPQTARDLGQRGLARARQFSWRRSAEMAVGAYRAAAETKIK